MSISRDMPPKEPLPKFSEDNPQVISTKNLALPLWLVVSMIGGCFLFTAYTMNLLNDINRKLDVATTDRWKRSHQREYNNQLLYSNPTLKVPDVDSISQRLDYK